MIIPRKYKETLYTIGAYADKLGMKAWVVGGAVRDFYLGRDTKDIDLTFEGNPESVAAFCIKKWGGEKRKFSQFGTYRVKLANGLKLDLATARKEHYAYPGALPEVSASDIKDDLFRRDFTANAWALSILPKTFGKSYDPFGAQKAIDKGVIKILHDKSFADDPTRLFRAARFAGRFGWTIDAKTARLMQDASDGEYPLVVSRERIRQELVKILEERNVKAVFELMKQYKLAQFIYPNLAWSDEISKARDVAAKVGVIACLLGSSGEEFLRHLHLPKEMGHEILGAWKVFDEQRSPNGYLTPLQTAILRVVCPGMKKSALEPCFIKGSELRDRGFSGRKISTTLERFGRLQWTGKIASRAQALSFLDD